MLRLLTLLVFFLSYTLLLYLMWILGPKPYRSDPEDYKFQFPLSMEGLKLATKYFSQYRDEHFNYVLLLFTLAYLYKQCFAIPGSFFMNLLAGALFGRWGGMLLVCPLTAIGASGCYLLSALVGKPLIDRFFEERFHNLKSLVRRNYYRLFYFLLSARVFPLTPHWLFNIFSPFLDIPLSKHALSIFIGLMPYNLICVQAGGMLIDIHNSSEVFNWKTTMELMLIAVVVFAFGFFLKNDPTKSSKT